LAERWPGKRSFERGDLVGAALRGWRGGAVLAKNPRASIAADVRRAEQCNANLLHRSARSSESILANSNLWPL
jgi:hypothetical protein